jgi:positive regulator of sigma E activity
MKEQGIVTGIEGEIVTLSARDAEVCLDCGVRTKSVLAVGCKACTLFQPSSKTKRRFNAVNSLHLALQINDVVEIEVRSIKVVKAGFLIFMAPLLAFACVYGILSLFPDIAEPLQIIFSSGAIFIWYGILFLLSRNNKNDWPVIMAKLESPPADAKPQNQPD